MDSKNVDELCTNWRKHVKLGEKPEGITWRGRGVGGKWGNDPRLQV
jgi:hypothetical protein